MRLIIYYVPRKVLPWIAVLCIPLSMLFTQMSKETWSFVALGRTVLLFPIFYIGYRIRPEKMERIRHIKRRWATVGIISLIVIEWVLFVFHVEGGIFTHDYTSNPVYALLKYVNMILVIVWFLCFAILLPGKIKWLSRWGRNSLIVYLLHMYFISAINRFVNISDGWLVITLMVICAFGITQLLSLDIFKRIYDNILSRLKNFPNML